MMPRLLVMLMIPLAAAFQIGLPRCYTTSVRSGRQILNSADIHRMESWSDCWKELRMRRHVPTNRHVATNFAISCKTELVALQDRDEAAQRRCIVVLPVEEGSDQCLNDG